MKEDTSSQAYWKATLSLLFKILIVWFLVSFGAGILFADMLNNIKLGGYPLGFWFAQQGSIYIFIALIFYYAKKMGDIDRRFNVQEE
ncbi:MAG: DUF4212 domain-containing protein [Burkholderiaceae bacterium]|jgi:putative solute:sodium symporter small subunit|nr:DUF4212 domain-containing protein [Burkholderiaceae bacterium]